MAGCGRGKKTQPIGGQKPLNKLPKLQNQKRPDRLARVSQSLPIKVHTVFPTVQEGLTAMSLLYTTVL